MHAGDLDRELYILGPADGVDDGYTTAPGGWSVLAKVWASKTDVRDVEKVEAQKVGAAITSRFQARWAPEIAAVGPEHQLLCEGMRYQVVGRKEIGRRDGIEFSAVAETKQLTDEQIEAIIGEAP